MYTLQQVSLLLLSLLLLPLLSIFLQFPCPIFSFLLILFISALAHNASMNWGYWAPVHGVSLFFLFPIPLSSPLALFPWTISLLQETPSSRTNLKQGVTV